jgi:hypothetical protein
MKMIESRSPLDRGLQRELLLAMQNVYPDVLREYTTTAESRAEANLLYLEDHGLCDSGITSNLRGGFAFVGCRITARGLDFLADDGGLSAILGVVTVRLHADTIRDLLTAKIEVQPISPEEKSTLRRHLAALSETALKAATTDLVHQGLHHLGALAPWLQRFAGL